MATTTVSSPNQPRTFLGHPLGLYVLFFTEMWERFSYYGMRALLMLYMVNYFRMAQKDASMIYKWYTSLVYLTPLLGGYLADRYLGNKRAVIIGATLMAIGHFLMAFEDKFIFYSALLFLIFGNGFFKPNMSTQVGRLYPPNDARRDGAYTIFYMGINLGAFLSPLICGWLAENTLGKYHSGFTVAGIGMVCGLCIYLFGLRWVVELDQTGAAKTAKSQDVQASAKNGTASPQPRPAPLSEEAAEHTSSATPLLNRTAPSLLAVLGLLFLIGGPLLALPGLVKFPLPYAAFISFNTMISCEIAAICFLISAWILSKVHEAVRDRVLAIYVLGLFVVFFWAAFEQAGNALNLWADKTTDRYLTAQAPAPELFPSVKDAVAQGTVEAEPQLPTGWDRWRDMFKRAPKSAAEEAAPARSLWDGWVGLWNPVPTAWFQSINALAIFLLAPLFAILWTALDRRGLNPSIPTKMGIGVLLMSLSFAVMIGAAKREDQPTSTELQGAQLPAAIRVNEQNQLSHEAEGEKGLEPYHAGRLVYDPNTHVLHLRGVLPDTERDRMVAATAPAAYVAKLKELQELKIKQDKEDKQGTVSVKLDEAPPGLDMRYAGFKKNEVWFDPGAKTLNTNIALADKDVKALLVAGGDAKFRASLNELYVQSSKHQVSAWWLFWFYILATLGELCLSPVGLSMVSKLAPARFATMLMGLWLLTSFFGNFAAGAFGEIWGTVVPTDYFWIFVAALGGAALVLFLLVRKIVAMMHGVN